MKITNSQSASLFILRVLIGWHLLYEGLIKVLDPEWSSEGFLKDSRWIFSGFFHWLAKDDKLLEVVDFTNQWGLVLIGLGLMSGLFTRLSAIAGMILILLYYLSAPPLAGLEYSSPVEGNYLIVNKNLIEAAALFLLAVFPSGKQFGVDLILSDKRNWL